MSMESKIMGVEVRMETGFHDDANAYVNVTWAGAIGPSELCAMNMCARRCGRAFASLLNAVRRNGLEWLDYSDEVQWYDGDGEEVVDEEDFALVRTVQCMVCEEDGK